jgi:hypothetical protein
MLLLDWMRGWLTQPSSAVTDPWERLHAELFAGMLLPVLVLGALSGTLQFALVPDFAPILGRIALGLGLVGLAYVLARTRSWKVGVALASFTPPLAASLVAAHDPGDPAWASFAVLGVLLAGALLEPAEWAS